MQIVPINCCGDSVETPAAFQPAYEGIRSVFFVMIVLIMFMFMLMLMLMFMFMAVLVRIMRHVGMAVPFIGYKIDMTVTRIVLMTVTIPMLMMFWWDAQIKRWADHARWWRLHDDWIGIHDRWCWQATQIDLAIEPGLADINRHPNLSAGKYWNGRNGQS